MISNFIDILKNMQTKFPVEKCTEKDKKEKGIYNSNNKYLCLILDKRFTEDMTLKIMNPYIWIGDESKHKEFKGLTGWGWSNINKSNHIDNFENPVHGYIWDEFVVGFVPYDNGNEDLKIWDLIKKEDD